MTTTTLSPTDASAASAVSVHRPRYEGANIRTWIGFKHFMYLVEEAVLDWLRENTPGARRLYHDHGLGVEIVDSSVLLPAVLEVDDEVHAEVAATGSGRFKATLKVTRDGREIPVLRGKVEVALVRVVDPPDTKPLSAQHAALLPEPVDAVHVAGVEPGPADAFRYNWRAPYYYCHFSDRVQHSGYVRTLEEVVDRFLADRGISVGRMLKERGWIPVVSRARVRMLDVAYMEEVIETTFHVDDILQGTLFDGRMDCYVRRGEDVLHVATARILHGYAISRGPDAGSMAVLDPPVIAALGRAAG